MNWNHYLKTLAITLGIAIIAMGNATAQTKGNREKRDRKDGPQMMMKNLNLTEDQQKEIKALHEKHQAEAKGSHEKLREAREALKEGMKKDLPESELRTLFENVKALQQKQAEMHFSHILEVRKILTPEQRKNFEGMMGKHRGPGHGDGICGGQDGSPPQDCPAFSAGE